MKVNPRLRGLPIPGARFKIVVAMMIKHHDCSRRFNRFSVSYTNHPIVSWWGHWPKAHLHKRRFHKRDSLAHQRASQYREHTRSPKVSV